MDLHFELDTLQENTAEPLLLPFRKTTDPLCESNSNQPTTSLTIAQAPLLANNPANKRRATISCVHEALPYQPIVDTTRPIEVGCMDTNRPAHMNAAFIAPCLSPSSIHEGDITHVFANEWAPFGATKAGPDDTLEAVVAGLHPLPATTQQLREIKAGPNPAKHLRHICHLYAKANPMVRNSWHQALKSEEEAERTSATARRSVPKLAQTAKPCSIGPCTHISHLLAQGYYRVTSSAGWRFPVGTPPMPRGLVPPNWSVANHVAGVPQPPFPPLSTEPSDDEEPDDVEDETSDSEPEVPRTEHSCPGRRFMAKLQHHTTASANGKRLKDERHTPCNKRPAL